MASIETLKAFFLEAAAATYAGGAVKKTTIQDLPSSKIYRYERGGLLYVDTYFVNGEYSGGQTIIYIEGSSTWLMQYHGWCKGDDREVIKFLKLALSSAYSKGKFNGGRGPAEFAEDSENGLVYQNWPQIPPYEQSFASFQGRERIYRKPNYTEDLFWYRYQGFLLSR